MATTNSRNSGYCPVHDIVAGQALSDDICLELDVPEQTDTRLLTLFERNSVLPVQKTFHRLINKNIKKDTTEEFIINVLEGSASQSPIANKNIGFMKINGKQIKRNLLKGADIELTFAISELRDLTITVHIPMLDQTFSQTFTPQKHYLPNQRLSQDIDDLNKLVSEFKESAIKQEEYENAAYLNKLQNEIEILAKHTRKLSNDDITDSRFKIEDMKREIAKKLFATAQEKEMVRLQEMYFDEKLKTLNTLEEANDEAATLRYKAIISMEGEAINSENPLKIEALTEQLRDLKYDLLWKSHEYIILVFEWVKSQQHQFRSKEAGTSLIQSGHTALEKENYTWLKQIVFQLLNLLPGNVKKDIGRTTGIV